MPDDNAKKLPSKEEQDVVTPSLAWEERIAIAKRHFQAKGYRVHSGLQFGCELVLYADDPSKVHSDFAVHVVPEDGFLDWRMMQTLVRSMPGLSKTLILAHVRPKKKTTSGDSAAAAKDEYEVNEIAIATEHAPFRHKKKKSVVGSQKKRQKKQSHDTPTQAAVAEEE